MLASVPALFMSPIQRGLPDHSTAASVFLTTLWELAVFTASQADVWNHELLMGPVVVIIISASGPNGVFERVCPEV